ncbi:MAG: DNA recombination/repair protein RecA, partial [Bacteroidota bacterium]
DRGVEKGVIKKAGAWFSYEDTKLGQGRDAVKALFIENPDLAEEIEQKIKQVLNDEAIANA